MLNRKKYTVFLILFLAALVAASFLPVEIPYKIKTKAMVKSVLEWELSRLPDGSLSSLLRNQLSGSIESYGVTEFRRGDVVQFEMRPEIFQGQRIHKGDTIGFLYSNDEQIRIAELEGQLEVLNAELAFYRSGDKEESIKAAEREVELTRESIKNQEKVLARSQLLMKDSLISIQQFELDEHELQMRKLALELALSQREVVSTGDKPERIQLIETQIQAVKDQIRQLKSRIEQHILLSPIDGLIVMNRNYLSSDVLLKIIDDEIFMGVAPALVRDLPHLDKDRKVVGRQATEEEPIRGRVHDFNNVSELLNGEMVVFFTVVFEQNIGGSLLPGKVIEIEAEGVPMNPQEYLWKLFWSPT